MQRLTTMIILGLALVGCAAGISSDPPERSSDPQMVIGRTWQWKSTITPVKKIGVLEPERYTILLMTDGRVQATFDCNRGGGSYTIAEGKISFGPMISTRMACPPDSLDASFMRDLQRATSFFAQDGELFLELPYDSGTMRFREAPTSEQADTPVGEIVKIRGTVVHKNVEGGFFAIEGDDGRVYDPINLPDRFKKDGLKVKVNAKLRNDMGSIHMVGDIIEIVEIDAE